MLIMITALGTGAIFGVGLVIAGMLNPAKVVGFLDIFGMWDPSLGLVMAGGIIVNATGHYFVIKRNCPVFDAVEWPRHGNEWYFEWFVGQTSRLAMAACLCNRCDCGAINICGCYRHTDRTPDGYVRPACLCCGLSGWFGYCRRVRLYIRSRHLRFVTFVTAVFCGGYDVYGQRRDHRCTCKIFRVRW